MPAYEMYQSKPLVNKTCAMPDVFISLKIFAQNKN